MFAEIRGRPADAIRVTRSLSGGPIILMPVLSWSLAWLPVAAFFSGAYLIWDVRRAVKNGEFSGMLGIVKKPVRKAEQPTRFWLLVAPCLMIGVAGVALAIISVAAIITRTP